MRLIHFIESIDVSTGGPARSVTHLIKKIISNTAHTVNLITAESSKPILKRFEGKQNLIYFFKRRKDLNIFLNRLNFKEIDILHGHGLWEYTVNKMCRIAQKKKIPYVITTRGMLEPWALKQKRLKKNIALFLYQRKNIRMASVIHATAAMEADQMRSLGFKNPIAIIPNGIDIEKYPKSYPAKSIKPKKILFLSRIHVKKGIENLIEAWRLIPKDKKSGWIIEIIGNGEASYINKLMTLISDYHLNNQIFLRGPVYGDEKIKLFREASILVLPSYSENFGIVVAEALASYTPVITTKGTPWRDIQKYNCGWWIDIGITPLVNTFEEILLIPPKELIKMGENGRDLIESKYTIDAISSQMVELYNWILNDKMKKPDFVILNKKSNVNIYLDKY